LREGRKERIAAAREKQIERVQMKKRDQDRGNLTSLEKKAWNTSKEGKNKKQRQHLRPTAKTLDRCK